MISQFCGSEAQVDLTGLLAYGFMGYRGQGVRWVGSLSGGFRKNLLSTCMFLAAVVLCDCRSEVPLSLQVVSWGLPSVTGGCFHYPLSWLSSFFKAVMLDQVLFTIHQSLSDFPSAFLFSQQLENCLLYTSDAADETSTV